MSSAYGTTVFCDDIRDEVSGKKTYVGVYMQDMIIDGPLPAIIPQFGLAITYLEPIEKVGSPVSIKVYVPGEKEEKVLLDIDLPLNRKESMQSGLNDPKAKYVGYLTAFKITPLVLEAEGFVRVRAYASGEEIKLGSLQIRTFRENEKENLATLGRL